jgi:hypothetical protein
MAVLIVEHHGTRRMAPLARRVLIGRRSGNHVVINDRAVSMIHAWIDKRGEECVLTDTGSRTGTLVNGKRITRPLPLVDGDVVTVGAATLTFRANGGAEPQAQPQQRATPVAAIVDKDSFPPSAAPLAAPIPPAGVPAPVAPSVPEPVAAQRVELTADGWLFDCACGAPLWAGASFAGRTAYCRYCGREVRVPDAATVAEVSQPVVLKPQAETPEEHDPAPMEEPRLAPGREAASEPVHQPPPLDAFAPAPRVAASDAGTSAPSPATVDVESVFVGPLTGQSQPEMAPSKIASSVESKGSEVAPTEHSLLSRDFTDAITTALESSKRDGRTSASIEGPSDSVPETVIEKKPDPAPEPPPVAQQVAERSTAAVPAPPVAPPAPASASSVASKPVAPAAAKPEFTSLKATRTCGICQSGILFNEKTTTCPSCGLTFHADCWVENRGCSAYGCPQVGILDAKQPSTEVNESSDDDAAVAAEAAAVEREAAKAYSAKTPFPWEFATLAASAFCLLVSVLTFGVPSLLIGAGTMIYLSKKPGVRRKTGILLLSTAIALVGFLVGLMASWFFWFDSRSGGGSRL